MKNYQLVLVLNSSLSEANRKKFIETVKSWLKNVKFTKEEDWGEKKLSYQIKRQNSGFYFNFLIEAKEGIANDLDQKLLASDNVLRYLLLKA